MIKIKNGGFTLSEVLITLTVVGALAALVIPGLIGSTNSKTMMTMLEGTVSILNNAVQNELLTLGTRDVKSTDIYNNPVEFLKKRADVKSKCTKAIPNRCYPASYKSQSGSTVKTWTSTKATLLSNGASIDILPDKISEYSDNYLPVSIDLNGAGEPNIIGFDKWIVCIALVTDESMGIHSGDVGSCVRTEYEKLLGESNASKLRTQCKAGSGDICYYLAETSGFDVDYIKSGN